MQNTHARTHLVSSHVQQRQLLTGQLLTGQLLLQPLLLLLLAPLRLPFLLQPQQPPLYAQHGADAAAAAVSCCVLPLLLARLLLLPGSPNRNSICSNTAIRACTMDTTSTSCSNTRPTTGHEWVRHDNLALLLCSTLLQLHM
jgi:hypothetical protein